MRSLLRPINLYLLLTYLALSAIPFVPLLFGRTVARPWQVIGVEVLAWIAVWAVLKRPAWFHALLLPAFLALPTEVYLFRFYGQGISTHHLGIIAETSPMEAMEFLGSTVWLMVAVLVGVVAWWGATFRLALRTRDLDWDDSSRWLGVAAMSLAAFVLAYGYEFGIAGRPAPASPPPGIHQAKGSAPPSADADPDSASVPGAARTGLEWPQLPHWARLPFEFEAFAQSWPFGVMARGVDFYNERVYLAELDQRSRAFRFGAQQRAADNAPEIVVMVLGESARADRWSLNGYARDTNPLLSQQANLVNLPDVITSVSATRLSVPVIISRKPATQSLKDGFVEKSFLTAFREAGFKTFWLSNQISFGKFDTPVSVFAREADVVQFLNLGGFTNNSNHDAILFDPLKIAMADPSPKKLIVLHTLGSHWNYSHRYPREFDRWQPSLFGVDKPAYTNLAIKPQLNNSYDSSILYTDWFLSTVIDRLRESKQLTSMLYVADHGQTLYDKSCTLAFHGHNTKYEFHVPAFVWYSDQFAGRYPDKVKQLRTHRKARLSTENMFHTLLDMGNVHYPGERLEWSFVNPQFKLHKRYVDSYGWTNYDNAVIRGDCAEVIDKGKPIKQ
ncbi:phosphoethanolamine transferase [Pseudoduganella sp. GCM10020061]|uniref:phosphoethanolamine transferase n=1 Tax=Pseudoduganella sp. GCM10020061 TaxID=3317345 RepID=UPI0036293F2F